MIMFCYLAITSLFIFHSRGFLYPRSWVYQFLAILTLNLISSLLIFIVTVKNAYIVYLLIFQISCTYIMTKPFSQIIWFEFFLIMIMFLEGILLLSTMEITFFTIFVTLLTLVTNHNGFFWGVEVAQRTWDLKGSLIFLTLISSGLSIIIKSTFDEVLRNREIIGNQKRIIQKLSEANYGLQEYANLAEEKSIINERLKITREIHDTVGYTMTNLLMMLEASTDLIKTDPVKLEKLLHQSLGIIKKGHEDIRQDLRILRNTEMKESGSIKSILNITSLFREATGVNISVEYGNLPRHLDSHIDHIIYRFLQEGMTNALTHGNAKNIDMQFRYDNNVIHIILEDDGCGSLEIEQGIGLNGMTERLAEVSGELTYGNTYLGFSLNAKIPWDEHG